MSDWEGAIDPVYFEDTYYLGAGKDGTVGIAHVPRPPANAPDRSRHVHLARHSVVLATRCLIPSQMPRYPRLRRWRPPGRRLGDAASKARPPWHLVCYLKEDVLQLTGVKKVKPFTRLSIVVLWLIALPQLLLFIASWEITLNGAPVPLWLSVLVAALAASLAVMVWRERPQLKSKTPPHGADTPSGQRPVESGLTACEVAEQYDAILRRRRASDRLDRRPASTGVAAAACTAGSPGPQVLPDGIAP